MNVLLDRFYAKVDMDHPSKCWNWTAGNIRGYGQFTIDQRRVIAHRWHYKVWHHIDVLPPEIHVMHQCDNRSCVNPYHLELGTALANIRDKHAKGRAADQRGEKNNAAKLTDEAVREIHRRCWSGENQRALAREFGVSPARVSQIRHGDRVGLNVLS